MAVVSDILISRMALALAGTRSNIESFAEETTEARQAKLFYTPARQQALESFDWGFARRTVALALSDTDPTSGWSYRYTLPSNYIKIRRVFNTATTPSSSPAPRQIELVGTSQITLLTNVEEALATYTVDIENENLFSPMFIKAFKELLGSYLAEAVNLDSKRSEFLYTKFLSTLSEAQASDGNEDVAQEPLDPSWVRAR